MLEHFVNLFYPHLCAACNQPLGTGQQTLCVACRLELPYVKQPASGENTVHKALWGRATLEFAFALLYFQKNNIVQELLHNLKYRNRQDIATIFGQEIGHLLQKEGVMESVDAIVPVPMHAHKLKTRGYNQSELLALHIANVTEKKLRPDLLFKKYKTDSQTRKGRIDRWLNSEEIFDASVSFDHAHVLLVDDVITTGATLEACYGAIKKVSPACKVSVATLAYTHY